MTKSTLHIFVRVINRRLKEGEKLEDILASYPKLSAEDIEEIRKALK